MTIPKPQRVLFQTDIDVVVCVLLLGLFPALFLPVLQAMLLIMMVVIGLLFRQIERSTFRALLTFPNVAIAQFLVFFFLNALIFNVVDGNKPHFRAIALESWSITFLCLVILALWLQLKKAEDVKQALIRWLPLGLTGSFLIASSIYLFGDQGPRIEVFTPGPLTPPFWFLVLTMCSFAWFSEMGTWHKIWRFLLLFMAGLMVVYGAARLVMLAWMFCSVALAVWFYLEAQARHRLWILLGAGLGILVCACGMLLADYSFGSPMLKRMKAFANVGFSYDEISNQFLRLKIWSASISIISDDVWFGAGQVNERIMLGEEMGWDRWLRAHQTYLSYLIAGGVPALISGLLMQSPVLAFLKGRKEYALFPAFLGLGVVVTLNCLTDSIFQSAVNVQIFMAALLFFLKARDVTHHP